MCFNNGNQQLFLPVAHSHRHRPVLLLRRLLGRQQLRRELRLWWKLRLQRRLQLLLLKAYGTRQRPPLPVLKQDKAYRMGSTTSST